jgi:hypothetical protein
MFVRDWMNEIEGFVMVNYNLPRRSTGDGYLYDSLTLRTTVD